MSMRGPEVTRWEEQLKQVFDRIDDRLEERYGSEYPLHPARAKRGTVGNREDDGLFNIGAAFSAGFGSEHGRGYIVEVRMSTLSNVPEKVQNTLENEVADLLEKELSSAFPGRNLKVVRDGPVFKVIGDLGLTDSSRFP